MPEITYTIRIKRAWWVMPLIEASATMCVIADLLRLPIRPATTEALVDRLSTLIARKGLTHEWV
jgi:hypothetical protein